MHLLLLVLKTRMNRNEPLSVFANTSVSYADADYYNKEIFVRVTFDSCLLNSLQCTDSSTEGPVTIESTKFSLMCANDGLALTLALGSGSNS